jgi:hypothetical protein
MTKSKWDDKMLIWAHEYAREGLTDAGIGRALNIPAPTFRQWLNKKPLLKYAIDRGRHLNKTRSTRTFLAYLREHLSDELRPLWDEILALDLKESGIDKFEAMLASKGKRARQQLFLYALVSSGFNASEACRRTGIDRKTMHAWIYNDPEFAELMEEIRWHQGNFFEGALVRKIAEGDTAATIFANKTFNRDRGYAEKVDVQVSGQIDHSHTVIKIDELDLPLALRRQLLEAIRARRSPEQLPQLTHESNGHRNGKPRSQ